MAPHQDHGGFSPALCLCLGGCAKYGGMYNAKAYSAQTQTSPLAPAAIQRRDPGPHDIQIQILFCGVCHTDLHIVRNEWHGTTYPCVPGHEIVGRVVKTGAQRQEIQGRRHRRRRLHGGFLPLL